jgi:hypothetical protein
MHPAVFAAFVKNLGNTFGKKTFSALASDVPDWDQCYDLKRPNISGKISHLLKIRQVNAKNDHNIGLQEKTELLA